MLDQLTGAHPAAARTEFTAASMPSNGAGVIDCPATACVNDCVVATSALL
jgi:hypothetical protein